MYMTVQHTVVTTVNCIRHKLKKYSFKIQQAATGTSASN